eukprot:c15011_g1_i1.p1 GENE.c15011_g1_i1~~c15011_g1_i1.p1  ORF type:complete len:167 (+),score=32.58 c15011_g1_i1:32-502(+)
MSVTPSFGPYIPPLFGLLAIWLLETKYIFPVIVVAIIRYLITWLWFGHLFESSWQHAIQEDKAQSIESIQRTGYGLTFCMSSSASFAVVASASIAYLIEHNIPALDVIYIVVFILVAHLSCAMPWEARPFLLWVLSVGDIVVETVISVLLLDYFKQ